MLLEEFACMRTVLSNILRSKPSRSRQSISPFEPHDRKLCNRQMRLDDDDDDENSRDSIHDT